MATPIPFVTTPATLPKTKGHLRCFMHRDRLAVALDGHLTVLTPDEARVLAASLLQLAEHTGTVPGPCIPLAWAGGATDAERRELYATMHGQTRADAEYWYPAEGGENHPAVLV